VSGGLLARFVGRWLAGLAPAREDWLCASPAAAVQPQSGRFALVDSMNVGAFMVAGEGVVAYSNGHLAGLLQRPLAEVAGAPLADVVALGADGTGRELFLLARSEGQAEGALALRCADGRTIGVRASMHHVPGSAGDVFVVVTEVATNTLPVPDASVATRLEAEQAQREHYERCARAIDAADEAFWEYDVRRGIATASDRFARMLGFEPEEFPASVDAWMRMIHPEDRERSMALASDHLAGKLDRVSSEYRSHTKTGGIVWLRTSTRTVLWDTDGKPLLVSGIHTDITARKEAEEAVRASEQRSRAMLEAMPVGVAWLDREGHVVACNSASDRLLGVTRDEHLSPDFDEALLPLFRSDGDPMPIDFYPTRRALREGRAVRDVLVQVRRADGNSWLSVSAIPLEAPLYGLLVDYSDVSERRDIDRRLRLALNVFTHTHEGIVVTDADAAIIDANASFLRSTGYTWEEIQGRNPRLLSSGLQSADFYAEMWRTLQATDCWRGQLWNRGKNGDLYAAMATLSVVRDDAGQIRNYVGMFSDITSLKKQQQVLEGIAYHDALTGLPNRLLFQDRLVLALARCRRQGRSLVVAFLDLDGFKVINDVYGHNVGDRFLAAMAEHLGMEMRAGDTLARFGGDEFTALLVDFEDIRDCMPVLARLQAAAARPVQIGDLTLHVTASIGVAVFPYGVVSADELIAEADRAMYVAKRSGKNCLHGYGLDLSGLRGASMAQ
jgi:diguanylate cyclase (GGDEF)-like protein/PAS domain S-box-containing protein